MGIELDAQDDKIWQLTMKALKASQDQTPDLTLVCAVGGCGKRLASCGNVPRFGPLMTSGWSTPLPSEVELDGRRLDQHQYNQHLRHQATVGAVTIDGELPEPRERNLVVTLLASPGVTSNRLSAPYVRCERHGDSAPDRNTVLSWLRSSNHRHQVAIPVSYPLLQINERRPDGDWLPGTPQVTTTTIQHRGTPMSVAELRELLARHQASAADDTR